MSIQATRLLARGIALAGGGVAGGATLAKQAFAQGVDAYVALAGAARRAVLGGDALDASVHEAQGAGGVACAVSVRQTLSLLLSTDAHGAVRARPAVLVRQARGALSRGGLAEGREPVALHAVAAVAQALVRHAIGSGAGRSGRARAVASRGALVDAVGADLELGAGPSLAFVVADACLAVTLGRGAHAQGVVTDLSRPLAAFDGAVADAGLGHRNALREDVRAEAGVAFEALGAQALLRARVRAVLVLVPIQDAPAPLAAVVQAVATGAELTVRRAPRSLAFAFPAAFAFAFALTLALSAASHFVAALSPSPAVGVAARPSLAEGGRRRAFGVALAAATSGARAVRRRGAGIVLAGDGEEGQDRQHGQGSDAMVSQGAPPGPDGRA